MEDIELFQVEKPTNRGKFSPDRELWNQIHEGRYVKWQLGASIQEVAEEEGVTYNAAKRSIQICETRLPRSQVVDARNTRLRLIIFDRLHEQYMTVMEGLMSDPNPIVRLKALDCFRKTMATETSAGVQVNTQVNVAARPEGDLLDFESEISKIRAKQKAAHEGAVIEGSVSQ